VSWYTKGGFTDENGKRHESGNHYSFPYWEVLNEIDFEHSTTPEDYAKRYDAIVEGIHKVSPDTKFMGIALAAQGAIRSNSNIFSIRRTTSPAFLWITSRFIFMRHLRWTRRSMAGSTPSLTRRKDSCHDALHSCDPRSLVAEDEN